MQLLVVFPRPQVPVVSPLLTARTHAAVQAARIPATPHTWSALDGWPATVTRQGSVACSI